MKHIKLISGLVLCLSLLQCGSDSFEEGKKAYVNKNYKAAIEHLLKVTEAEKKNTEYFQMLSLSYMFHGQQLYNRTKNVKAFSGNFEKAQKIAPVAPSNEFKQIYSKLLCSLAESYISTKPKNEIEKNKNIQSAFHVLEVALSLETTNAEVQNLYSEIKDNHFQKLLAKAKNLYKKAQKSGKIDYYFSSKHYLENAAEYDTENAEVKSLCRKLRKKLLPILDDRDGVSLAITDYIHEKDHLTMMLAIENYLQSSIFIDPKNLKLVDRRGNIYQIDKEEMKFNKFLGKECLKHTKLDPQKPYVGGIVVFSVPENTEITYLSYNLDQKEITRKYFQ